MFHSLFPSEDPQSNKQRVIIFIRCSLLQSTFWKERFEIMNDVYSCALSVLLGRADANWLFG